MYTWVKRDKVEQIKSALANTNSTLASLKIEETRATANIKVHDYSLKFCW